MIADIVRDKVVSNFSNWVGATTGSDIHKKIIDIYNSHTPLPRNYKVKLTDAWCAATVSAVWIKTGIAPITPIECSCSRMIALAKKSNIWVENDKFIPKPADAILYDWDDKTNYATTDNTGEPEHVGIVKAVLDNNIIVLEGNMKGGIVGTRTVKLNGRYIRGFITPNYDKITTIVNEILDGKWGNGDIRKQRIMKAGYSYSFIQSLVNKQIIACNNVAHEVIEGKWGNGNERKRRLKAAGYPYNFVQSLVNAYLGK